MAADQLNDGTAERSRGALQHLREVPGERAGKLGLAQQMGCRVGGAPRAPGELSAGSGEAQARCEPPAPLCCSHGPAVSPGPRAASSLLDADLPLSAGPGPPSTWEPQPPGGEEPSTQRRGEGVRAAGRRRACRD